MLPRRHASVGQVETRKQAVTRAKGVVLSPPIVANPALETQAVAQAPKLLVDLREKGRVKLGHPKGVAWARAAQETRMEGEAAVVSTEAAVAVRTAADDRTDHAGAEVVAAVAQTSSRTAGRPR